MVWLLDSNAWIHYLKHADSPIRQRLTQALPVEIVTCSIVRAELLFGARKYGNAEKRTTLVLETLSPYVSYPFDEAAVAPYVEIRHELEKSGWKIGPNDLLIASICLVHNCTLVTSNESEFGRVRNLHFENWLK